MLCFCKEKFEDKHTIDKKHHKVRDHWHYTGDYREPTHSICNLKYSVPKDKNKESSCLKYFDASNVYGWEMSQ